MKAKELQEKSVDDLREMERATVREAFDARFKNYTNRLDDTSRIRKSRRDVARIQTVIRQKTAGEAKAS